ncbi:MAG: thiamine pyrophosphate-dependent enzyme [Candidatus Krumholzibacteria bacterium]|nr:thiamine pyrophosphate-dependent enzyme [Candidatus Krumholzibacteria bacterium]
MDKRYLDTEGLPFCKGCSHHLIARAADKALAKLGIDPLDVVIVTDIGCHGIIDKRFSTHTVHGLHGRSIALAMGISASLNDPRKKVLVFIGDGGTTIGINHLIGAAHRNIDMTVVVHNNMLYGMTGGQRSDLTPGAFRTRSPIEGFTEKPLDVLRIARDSGAAWACRIAAHGDISDAIVEAMRAPGFALLEVLEICPSYGVKENRELKVTEMEEKLGLPLEKHVNEHPATADVAPRAGVRSLLEGLAPIPVRHGHSLEGPLTIMISGSAGEGVQSAADIFVTAAISCGLEATKKSAYPVTVGVGFSTAVVTVSPARIEFTGVRKIDWALASSADGMQYLSKHIEGMGGGTVMADASNAPPATAAAVKSADFRGAVPPKEVNLLMLFTLLEMSGIFPPEAFADAIAGTKLGARIDPQRLIEAAKVIGSTIG